MYIHSHKHKYTTIKQKTHNTNIYTQETIIHTQIHKQINHIHEKRTQTNVQIYKNIQSHSYENAHPYTNTLPHINPYTQIHKNTHTRIYKLYSHTNSQTQYQVHIHTKT